MAGLFQKLSLCLVFLTAIAAYGADSQTAMTGADWELRVLGITNSVRLEHLQKSVKQTVTLAIVGQGGVSQKLLLPVLTGGDCLEYRSGTADPNSNTHDTQAARVILELTNRLGIRIKLLVYQPDETFVSVAEALNRAAGEADTVVFFQSFWGPEVELLRQSIGCSSGTLFIAPYAEIGAPLTGTSIQGHSTKGDDGGLKNFITAAHLARNSAGQLLKPASREGDTEIINFIAPSYYASRPGGTCPAAEVTTAVTVFIVAASRTSPAPEKIIRLMRDTVIVDRPSLSAVPEFTEEAISRLENELSLLAEGKPAKLYAPGILNLWSIYNRMFPYCCLKIKRPQGVLFYYPTDTGSVSFNIIGWTNKNLSI